MQFVFCSLDGAAGTMVSQSSAKEPLIGTGLVRRAKVQTLSANINRAASSSRVVGDKLARRAGVRLAQAPIVRSCSSARAHPQGRRRRRRG